MPDYLNDLKFNQVTPCVGVWIETENQQKPYTTLWVTPCVGVWIETAMRKKYAKNNCHTLRGCVD